jgi:hypothetical protein
MDGMTSKPPLWQLLDQFMLRRDPEFERRPYKLPYVHPYLRAPEREIFDWAVQYCSSLSIPMRETAVDGAIWYVMVFDSYDAVAFKLRWF